MKLLFTLFFTLCIFSIDINAQQIEIADWLNNRKAAVSITFDDGCSQQFSSAGNTAAWGPANSHGARGLLDSLNMKGTFYIITNKDLACENFDWTTVVSDLDASGHEVGAHTVNHPHMDEVAKNNPSQLDFEFKKSRDTLNYYLHRQKCETVAYPEGNGGYYYAFNNEHGDQRSKDSVADVYQSIIRQYAHKYFITARGAGVDADDFITYSTDSANIYYPDFYFQIPSLAVHDTMTTNSFCNIVDNAIWKSGWFIPMYHMFNVTDGSEGLTVTTAKFRQQLLNLNKRRNSLWIAPYVDVFKYFAEKRAAQVSVVKPYDDSTMIISLKDTLPDGTYHSPLTININNCSWASKIKGIYQKGDSLPFHVWNNSVTFNAIPDKGNIAICTVCSSGPVNPPGGGGHGGGSDTLVHSPGDTLVHTPVRNVILPEELISIYPNPAKDLASLSFTIKECGLMNVSLYNSYGALIRTYLNGDSNPGTYTMDLDLSVVPAGIYLCKLTLNGISQIKKIIVLD